MLRHNSLSILIKPCIYNVKIFLPTLAAAGVILAVALNFGLLYLRNWQEIRLIYYVSSYVAISNYWLIQFFSLHACLPAIYSENAIKEMMTQSRQIKLEQKQVRALKPFGFSLGVFVVVKRRTALDNFQSILDYTVILLLLV